jgi:Fe-Mn family superoxide dismutase
MENFEVKFKAGLKPKPMAGLSQRQIDDHFDVKYKGYVTKFNEIQEKLKSADKKGANPNYSEVRELMVERLFNHNSIKLHEAYWQCLAGAGDPPTEIKKMLDEDFGSYKGWQEEFKACGLEARGWAILGFDMDSGRLFNFVTDMHSIAPINVVGLMIMDMYEHAYYLDYGATVKRYIEEGFLANMNWDYAAQSLERYHVLQHRKELLKAA